MVKNLWECTFYWEYGTVSIHNCYWEILSNPLSEYTHDTWKPSGVKIPDQVKINYNTMNTAPLFLISLLYLQHILRYDLSKIFWPSFCSQVQGQKAEGQFWETNCPLRTHWNIFAISACVIQSPIIQTQNTRSGRVAKMDTHSFDQAHFFTNCALRYP